jgi:hypothetical protein
MTVIVTTIPDGKKMKRITYVLLLAIANQAHALEPVPLYMDQKQPVKQWVRDLISKWHQRRRRSSLLIGPEVAAATWNPS